MSLKTTQCVRPFVKDGLPLPCGKCYPCKVRRASQWSVRLMKEAEVSTSAFFVTLTYEIPHRSPNGFTTLHAPDMQIFMKRLRRLDAKIKAEKRLPDAKIKYYTVGEYGSKLARPHYHMIIFNCQLEALCGREYSYEKAQQYLLLDGEYKFISPTWEHGYISVGKVTKASVGYTLKYISKGSQVPKHKNDDREKEKAYMSKGLGAHYLEREDMYRWHMADLENRMYVPLHGGKKAPMPRYYRERIYTVDEIETIKNSIQRKQTLDTIRNSSLENCTLEETLAKSKQNRLIREHLATMKGKNNNDKL